MLYRSLSRYKPFEFSARTTLRRMAHYITTHDTNGAAIFSSKGADTQKKMSIPIGDIRIISSSHQFPLNLSFETDIGQYGQDRLSPIFPGLRRICPDGGTATCLMSMQPGGESAMHRTMTHDTIIIIEGEVEVTLDSGESCILRAGDSLVQRATMHKWRNVTPDNGWVRWVVFIQAVAEPLCIGENILTQEWNH